MQISKYYSRQQYNIILKIDNNDNLCINKIKYAPYEVRAI